MPNSKPVIVNEQLGENGPKPRSRHLGNVLPHQSSLVSSKLASGKSAAVRRSSSVQTAVKLTINCFSLGRRRPFDHGSAR
jgi:hypothetical protein